MKYHYIAIEREYGSGGTRIARRLSEVCGVPCYGREILEAVAKRLGTSVEDIQWFEETVSTSLLYTLSVLGQSSTGNLDSLSPEDQIFLEEQTEIRSLAEHGPAIFLGHCAGEAIKNRSGVVTVYIHAANEDKRRRIAEDYRIAPEQIDSLRKRMDKRRANYYFANTARRWSDLKNYDLVLNSSKLGIDGCVAALRGLLAQPE